MTDRAEAAHVASALVCTGNGLFPPLRLLARCSEGISPMNKRNAQLDCEIGDVVMASISEEPGDACLARKSTRSRSERAH